MRADMAGQKVRTNAWRSRASVVLLLVLGAVLALRGVVLALENRVALHALHGAWLRLELFLLFSVLGLALAALALELQELARGRPRTRTLAPIGALFVVLVASSAAFLAFVQPFQRLWFDLALAGSAGAWASVLLLERYLPEPVPRTLAFAGKTVLAASAALVLLEIGLRAVDACWPAPLLARVGDAPRRALERFRCKPGEVRFGFACNSRGYYDEELYQKRPGERLIASIGDSFNVGSVPHAWHMTTVCERELGVSVHNLGVAGAGPPEYLSMLVDDALPLDPDLVLIHVFVGNDLTYGNVQLGRPHARLRSWLERDQVLVCLLPQRLARIAAERDRLAGHMLAGVQGERVPAASSDPASSTESFPWLSDPRLEQASLSEAAFLRLETQRARDVCRGTPSAFRDLCETLSAARRACGSTPLGVVIVPDEFQVEDELWRAVLDNAQAALDRDAPERLLASWLASQGIPFLDLLPVLRAEPPLEDGKRHVYHLRDTHFNARGNRIAGRALAQFAEQQLAQ